MAGAVTATSGKIGGFEITNDAITGSNFFISGASVQSPNGWEDTHLFISSSAFRVNASGVISASAGNITVEPVAPANSGTLCVGRWASYKDSDGYAKLHVNLPLNNGA